MRGYVPLLLASLLFQCNVLSTPHTITLTSQLHMNTLLNNRCLENLSNLIYIHDQWLGRYCLKISHIYKVSHLVYYTLPMPPCYGKIKLTLRVQSAMIFFNSRRELLKDLIWTKSQFNVSLTLAYSPSLPHWSASFYLEAETKTLAILKKP